MSTVNCHCLHKWSLYVSVAIISYGSYDHLSDPCCLMPWRCWSRHTFHITWTPATHFSTAYLMDWWPGCSLPVMLLHVSCQVLDSTTTLCQCYTCCTGFLFRSGWTSRISSQCADIDLGIISVLVQVEALMAKTRPAQPYTKRTTVDPLWILVEPQKGLAAPQIFDHCRQSAALVYLSSEEDSRQLHSTDLRTCVVRPTFSNFGDRCFAAVGPMLWNSLSSWF